VTVNPAALIFGSDLPSTRARIPFQDIDIDRITKVVGEEHVNAVLETNARHFYRLSPP
jgi:predicted TIM-barrel fold metal-dependent hydrolase